MKENKKEKMRKVRDDVVNCKSCPLYDFRVENGYLPVIGEGNHDAEIMFIGEAPGLNEAKTGRPFCGRAGKILDELLDSINVPREEVYIANILKDRPPENRDPNPEEIRSYTPFLERQIEIINPKAICPLGRFAMQFILEKYGLKNQIEGISKIHGKEFSVKSLFGDLKIVPLYHPAAATYNPNMIETLKEDFKIIKKYA